MAGDPGAVDAAMLTLLRADAELLALCPDGVQWGIADHTAVAFVLVERADHSTNGDMFGGVYGEIFVYLVAAVLPDTSSRTARAAAKRIRQLLEGSTAIAPEGYGLQAPIEELRNVRPPPAVDEANPDRRLQQWGGLYQVLVQSLT